MDTALQPMTPSAGWKMAGLMAEAEARALPDSERLLNRELSWLEWNGRVLELAADPDRPLLERVRFCAIFSSNLDEFFMVRVAGLLGQAEAGTHVRSTDGRFADEVLAAIRERVLDLTAQQARLWTRELRPALEEQGIVVGGVDDCDEQELAELEQRFEREVFPVVTPLAVGPGQRFPYISGLSISLGVFVRDPEQGEERFARVKVPEGLPRFLAVGTRGLRVPLEHVIAHFLSWLFPGMELLERSVFRVTRDADFEISDEADDLLEAVEVELRRRRFGDVVRLEVSNSTSSRMLERLERELGVGDESVYRVQGLLDLADALELRALERPDLKDEAWPAVSPPAFVKAREAADPFAAVRGVDVLVHHPYDSFAASFEAFLCAAAEDPDVIAIKTTVYRTSDDSPLVPALIEASERGKQAVCLVELKARFDERRNIEWSRALEQAGVHVVYGFPSLKTHAKATLVVRREGRELHRYVHLSTGNYNAVTARAYEDIGLFTDDEDLAADVAQLFNYLTGFGRPSEFRKLLVAPFALRDRLVDEIRAVADAAQAGDRARIRIKVNALTDVAVVDELYRASQAGADVQLVIRSVCALRPGVPGLSESISVRSVLGRFLEHSRLFLFEAGPRSTCYLGSADLMPRNLSHRVEVVAPVENEVLRAELSLTFDTLLSDTASSWELAADGSWHRVRPAGGDQPRSAQEVLMRRARRRAAEPRPSR
ncbi:MAG TPA: polyphosphate kinase 1 [Gaiellaceae bacterium]|jgi:polyphosphate kinase